MVAFAATPRIYSSSAEFYVADPYEPNIVTTVSGGFVDSTIHIQVNMSAQQGVVQLAGTYSVTVQIWNDTKGAYVNFQNLVSNKPITLTPAVTTVTLDFTTKTPGQYNALVEFTAISVKTG